MDEEGFRELYSAMHLSVFTYAARHLGPDQAKDVFSETFEIAWRRRAEFPASHAEWPAWLIGITRNKVRHELQQVTRRPHDHRYLEDYPSVIQDVIEPDVADHVVAASEGRRVWHQLREAEQEMLNLTFVRGLRTDDAAALMGLSVTAYTTRLTRLRERIRSLQLDVEPDASGTQQSGSRS